MNTFYIRQIFEAKFNLIDNIHDEHLSDALLLALCHANGVASKLWPRKKEDGIRGIDKNRFCELMVEFGPKEVMKISLPFFYQYAKSEDEKAKMVEKFPNIVPDARVVTADGDCFEEEILKQVPEIQVSRLRKYSYASVIYEDLRCSLVHEGFLPEKIQTSHPMHSNEKIIGYINQIYFPSEEEVEQYAKEYRVSLASAKQIRAKQTRHMYLPPAWILDVSKHALWEVFKYWDTSDSFEKNRPGSWWLLGR